jgi:DNA mismatch repair protein MutS2
MAQCGLPVAAASASLPVFNQLRADIGDHQSIDADLSTFSAHLCAVSRYLKEAAQPALFLFDEIGTGTEPGEGAALGRAVLERLLDLRVTAIATTHHAALKAWAFADSRVASAAMEFDEETLQPTYRVIEGAAGASAGIAIAARLGLEPALVARAKELAGREGMDAEAAMARLRDATVEVEARLLTVKEEQAKVEDARIRLEAKVETETKRVRDQAGRALEAALAEFKDLSRRELASITNAKEKAAAERGHAKVERKLRTLAQEKRDTIAPPAVKSAPIPLVIAPGATVRIVSLEREGRIVSVRGDRIEVRMGSATFSVARGDLEAASGEPASPEKPKTSHRLAALAAASRSAGRSSSDEPADTPPIELHLLGKTVDEALPEVDRFLDASSRSARTDVRIIHGHGTGRLRVAVRAHLRGHPQVAAFRPGGAGEGGDGATVVTLL